MFGLKNLNLFLGLIPKGIFDITVRFSVIFHPYSICHNLMNNALSSDQKPLLTNSAHETSSLFHLKVKFPLELSFIPLSSSYNASSGMPRKKK